MFQESPCKFHMPTVLAWVVISAAIHATTFAGDGPAMHFERIVAPILEKHCIRCHYPGNAKGDISLSSPDDLSSAGYIVPNKPDESYLIELIDETSNQPPQMPKDSPKLTESEVHAIREWIRQGAEWPDDFRITVRPKADSSWWSLQPLATADSSSRAQEAELKTIFPAGPANEIDLFVDRKLREAKLHANPEADLRTLIRRLTYDLTGLPPTPQEVNDFVSDTAPEAYSRLVDRLLSSPKYGEQWGRHWLDVVRFGESTGYERNVIIEDAWPFRDYIIAAFNDDKPMNQLIREHLAGDILGRGNPQIEVGSAFLVNGPYDNVGNQDAVQATQIRANTIDEMIRATTEAFLGLTVGCARCHDHKFDPIPQSDYYQFFATFAGVKHGSAVLATDAQQTAYVSQTTPLQNQKQELESERTKLFNDIRERAEASSATHQANWNRDKVDRRGTTENFSPRSAKYIKLVCEGRDDNPKAKAGFRIDEFEVWTSGKNPRNVALKSNGGNASGPSRTIEDFPGAYGAHLAIDGETGERFISAADYLLVELAEVVEIGRIVFSSARNSQSPEQPKFVFVGEYSLQSSMDGKHWETLASSLDRKPVSEAHRRQRLIRLEQTVEEEEQLLLLNKRIRQINKELGSIPPLPKAWIGTRDENAAQGPFFVHLGGDPQRVGEAIFPASPSIMTDLVKPYTADALTSESQRRVLLANWITDDRNALVARVLANRVWHYHFGTGIVATPNDFGYMGSPPSHPALLDYLAAELIRNDWRLKPLHKMIVMSAAYRQSSQQRPQAAELDADSRLLWRFPPRRLTAEEIRDSMLSIAGCLESRMRGPGFRLYRYLQDNVATYVPLDDHGPETYRRGVYHQNARACNTDLLTEFDQPDCAFSSPRRSVTTTPLQALTALNHQFTVDMAQELAHRLEQQFGSRRNELIARLFELCCNRRPTTEETIECSRFLQQHSLSGLCRAILNTSEFIYIR